MRKPSACVNDMDTESGHARFGNIRLSPMGTSGGHAFPQTEQPAGPPPPPLRQSFLPMQGFPRNRLAASPNCPYLELDLLYYTPPYYFFKPRSTSSETVRAEYLRLLMIE